MSIMDELKRLAHPDEDPDEDYDDELEEYEDEEEEEVEERPAPRASAPKTSFSETRSTRDAKVVNLGSGNAGQWQVVLVEPSNPENVENMREIATHLLNHRTVVLNLEKTDDRTMDHLLHFMGGVAYAVKGAMKRVADRTYIVMPQNVNMEGELRDELESNGLLF